MTCPAERTWSFRDFWDAPHRPLFLAAVLCALITVACWPLFAWVGPTEQFPAVLWHVHELIFGFAGAAIGGYLLTALPSWTSRPPMKGSALIGLTMVWILARLVTGLAGFVSPITLVTINAGYFAVLTLILAQQIIAAKAYQKLGFIVVCAGMGIMDALFLTASLAGSPWFSLELARVMLLGVTLLMITIGTRAIPAFTQNWLIGTGRPLPRARSGRESRALAQGFIVAVIIARLLGQEELAAFSLILAALSLFWNMRGWRCLTALTNPLLAALHLAFLWLPAGLLMLGLIGLNPSLYPASDAVHAITIGGMSGLIMAIAGRAAAHSRTGVLKATSGFVLGVVSIWLATWARLAAPVFATYSNELLQITALIWCLGWMCFLVGFQSALVGPPRRPVLSGQRHANLISMTGK